jgi:hypothetical protein
MPASFLASRSTPGAPWRIRLDDKLQQSFAATVPDGFLAMRETIRRLGVSRQSVLQRIKRGELVAVHVCQGRRKGTRGNDEDSLKPPDSPVGEHCNLRKICAQA